VEVARELGAPLAVIVNASAGTADAEKIPVKLRELFGEENGGARIIAAGSGDEVVARAKEEIARGARTVVAAGGDGTVSAVAALLVGTDRVLGVLPLGTLNHFARDLGLPADLEGASRVVLAGVPTPVDVGEVNGKIFLNNSSIGLYASMVRHREKQQERLGRSKWAALLWATLRVLMRTPPITVRIHAEGRARIARTRLLFIGNNEYEMTGFQVGVRKRLDGGALWLYLTRKPGSWALIRLALRALFGTIHDADDFEPFRVTEARIETRRPRLHVATDGEVGWFDSPLHYRVRPGALQVMLPRGGGSERESTP